MKVHKRHPLDRTGDWKRFVWILQEVASWVSYQVIRLEIYLGDNI